MQSWLSLLLNRIGPEVDHQINAPMAKFTTYQIGGPADVIFFPKNKEALAKVVKYCVQDNVPFRVFGGGSNTLISDAGIRGVVILLRHEFRYCHIRENGRVIEVGAGELFSGLTKEALKLGWKKALGFVGTPGHVGGALFMNAGTRQGEIADVVEEVYVINEHGPCVIEKAAMHYGYRHSVLPKNHVIYGAKLRCLAEDFIGRDLCEEGRSLLMTRHETQPKIRSAGSIFKNPPGDFSGRLIECAGLKGTRIGNAEISTIHANFIINHGQASAMDVYQLACLAQKKVLEKFNQTLEFELQLVGEFPFEREKSEPAAQQLESQDAT